MSEQELNKEAIIKEYLNSMEFINKINGIKGEAGQTVLETFKTEKLPVIMEEEFTKRMTLEQEKNKKTPEQIQLEDALKRIEKMELETKAKERERMKAENKTLAMKALSEKKLPSDLLDFIVSDETEKTTENVELFANMMDKYTTGLSKDKISNNNIDVPGQQEVISGGSIPEPGPDASKKEWAEYLRKTK